MTPANPKPEAPLPDYFYAVEHKGFWRLFCKTCRKAFLVHKDDAHPEDVLDELSAHAKSHQAASQP